MAKLLRPLLVLLCAVLYAVIGPNLVWSAGAGILTVRVLVWHLVIIANATVVLLLALRAYPNWRETFRLVAVLLTALSTILTIVGPEIQFFALTR